MYVQIYVGKQPEKVCDERLFLISAHTHKRV